jgi:hypothetical protein
VAVCIRRLSISRDVEADLQVGLFQAGLENADENVDDEGGEQNQ